jgi:hypothetical protein
MGGATAAVFGLRAPFFLAAAILCLVALVTFARVTPGAIVSARRAAESAISA